MSGLFGKMIAHFLNEVIVKALANSKTFQRFALKTDTYIQSKKAAAAVIKEETLKKSNEVGPSPIFSVPVFSFLTVDCHRRLSNQQLIKP